MNTNEKQLWTKISAYSPDDESSTFKFSARLARENAWSKDFANNVIEEYKKFIFLCCVSDKGVTPSDQVDQAWHLHLTYTRSYWTDLCKNTLNRELHHNPTKGGEKEGNKFNDFYTETLKLYLEKFGAEPPPNIWPENEKRFSDIHFQRINLQSYWLIRKPQFNKSTIRTACLLLAGFLFVQSQSGTGSNVIGLIVFVGFILWAAFNNKNGGGSGCSSGGCGGSLGCGGDSGCGSGCSGCGGCGGGD